MTMITGARNVERARLAAVLTALAAEEREHAAAKAAGRTPMKMNHGQPTLRFRWARHLGLRGRATYAEVRAAVEGLAAEMERGA